MIRNSTTLASTRGMHILDALLSSFCFWRRIRGGVWERWLLDQGGGSSWFNCGPHTSKEWETQAFVLACMKGRTSHGLDAARRIYESARPHPGCRGTPVVEDYRT